jgi:hypothetical protein
MFSLRDSRHRQIAQRRVPHDTIKGSWRLQLWVEGAAAHFNAGGCVLFSVLLLIPIR